MRNLLASLSLYFLLAPLGLFAAAGSYNDLHLYFFSDTLTFRPEQSAFLPGERVGSCYDPSTPPGAGKAARLKIFSRHTLRGPDPDELKVHKVERPAPGDLMASVIPDNRMVYETWLHEAMTYGEGSWYHTEAHSIGNYYHLDGPSPDESFPQLDSDSFPTRPFWRQGARGPILYSNRGGKSVPRRSEKSIRPRYFYSVPLFACQPNTSLRELLYCPCRR